MLNMCLSSLAPPLSACLEICLLQIARALGEALQSAMRTSQAVSETGGISSSTPISPADGKAQLVSPALFHFTEPKKKKEGFQPLMDTSELVKLATFRIPMKHDKQGTWQFRKLIIKGERKLFHAKTMAWVSSQPPPLPSCL